MEAGRRGDDDEFWHIGCGVGVGGSKSVFIPPNWDLFENDRFGKGEMRIILVIAAMMEEEPLILPKLGYLL